MLASEVAVELASELTDPTRLEAVELLLLFKAPVGTGVPSGEPVSSCAMVGVALLELSSLDTMSFRALEAGEVGDVNPAGVGVTVVSWTLSDVGIGIILADADARGCCCCPLVDASSEERPSDVVVEPEARVVSRVELVADVVPVEDACPDVVDVELSVTLLLLPFVTF